MLFNTPNRLSESRSHAKGVQETAFEGPSFHDSYLKDETLCVRDLIQHLSLDSSARKAILEHAAQIIRDCREISGHGSVFDAILQEYGLSTEEGVTLMRLVEALIRTADADTAHLLIRDKLSDRDWQSHSGDSPAFIVNRATNGLSMSAAWVKATGGQSGNKLISKLGDSVLYRAIKTAMSVMSRHFVLGQDIEDAQSRAAPFAKKGYSFSYDMLGEAAHTWADAKRYKASYMHAMTEIVKTASADTVFENSGLSVKLSALHPRYEIAKKEACVPPLIQDLIDLALLAKNNNVGLTIDAEEADRLELSMVIAKALLETPELSDWDGLSIVVQAYQRRAPDVIKYLLDTARNAKRRFSIRLVKGAYWDSEIKRAQEMGLESYPVFTRKENTDVSYLACARQLLEADDIVFPQFATHNAATMAAILHMAGNGSGYEFQRLHGMGGILHDEMMKRTSIKSRIYAPVGQHKDLLPYLVRRLLENGANSSFVNQFLNPDVLPEVLAEDPVSVVLSHTEIPHPKIPQPRNLFNGARLSAMGLDTTQTNVAQHLESLPKTYKNIKAQTVVAGRNQRGKIEPVWNPSNVSEVVGTVTMTTQAQLEKALKSAQNSKWISQTTAQERAECLRRAAKALQAKRDKFLTLCVKEAGKTWQDAIAELREAIEFLEYYANRAEDPSQAGRTALGVVACISPWNFPLAIFLGPIAAALGAGNAVVCKPAEQTPLIASAAVSLLHKAGVPKDALHLVFGPGHTIGTALIASPEIKGVCFTGSTNTAKVIAKTLADTDRALTPLIAETGGINAMIIDSTALMEQAVSDIVAGAFQSAGQRCSACRLVCIQDDVADGFIEMLSGAMEVLEIGDPAKLSTDLGPVIDANALGKLQNYISEKRKIWPVLGETKLPALEIGALNGHFLAPIAFEIPRIDVLKDEQFGPVLHVYRYKAKAFNKVIEAINGLGYGLTFGLHTRIDHRAKSVADTACVGNLYVNRNQIGAVVGVQPFGGEGLSGTGPKAGGPYYLRRLSKNPVVENEFEKRFSLDAQEAVEADISLIAQVKKVSQLIDKAKKFHNKKGKSPLGLVEFRALASEFMLSSVEFNGLEKAYADVRETTALPGPTGETNAFRHVPRGVLLCIADGNIEDLKRQIVKCLLSENTPMIVCNSDQKFQILESMQAVNGTIKAGVNDFRDLIYFIQTEDLQAALLADIDGVIVDGSEREAVAKVLAYRDGAILPVLSLHDTIDRYCLERTVTTDVSAAGGNATLLAL